MNAGTEMPGPVSPGSPWQSAAPVLAFIAANRVAGLRWAVAVATVTSIVVAVQRRRSGLPLGRFLPIVTIAIVARGLIGIITGSETVYFGLGIATKYLAAAVLLGSVLVKKPLAAYGAPFFMRIPEEMANHRLFHSTMAHITAIAGVYYAISASFDIWLFRRSSVESYVLVRLLANWPLGVLTLLVILMLLQWRLQRIPGVPSVATLIEERQTGLLAQQHGSISTPSLPRTPPEQQ